MKLRLDSEKIRQQLIGYLDFTSKKAKYCAQQIDDINAQSHFLSMEVVCNELMEYWNDIGNFKALLNTDFNQKIKELESKYQKEEG